MGTRVKEDRGDEKGRLVHFLHSICIELPHSSGSEVRVRNRLVASLELPLTYKEHTLALETGDRRAGWTWMQDAICQRQGIIRCPEQLEHMA